MRKICLVNRYYPPNPGIAGEEASNLVGYLSKTIPDCKITVIHIDAPYLFSGASSRQPLGSVITLKTFFRGSQNIAIRFIRNLIEGYRLISMAVEDADLIISMTDPPLLNYWAGILCKRKNIPWIYWAVDLYPVAYKAAKLAGEDNIFYNHLDRSCKNNMPSFLIALGEAQAAFIQDNWEFRIPHVVLPCGIQNELPSKDRPSWRDDDTKIYFSYAGNMSEPHDEEFLLDFIGCLDENRHRCILSVYGSQSRKIIKKTQTHPAVAVASTIKRDELSFIDVHLVSLKPAWTHVSVPSKAVSAICASRALLFHGSQETDTWRMFHKASWNISALSDPVLRKKEIYTILAEASQGSLLCQKHENAGKIRQQLINMRADAYLGLSQWIQST